MSAETKKRICIVGAGAFGSAINALFKRKGFEPAVWDIGMDMKDYVPDKDFVVFAVPSQVFREVFSKACPYIGSAIVVNVAKGIEIGSLRRMSEIAKEIMPSCKYVALSGPSHAEEVSINLPTSVSIASECSELLPAVQDLFLDEHFRVYINDDLIGLELAGSLKNVIALATGISDGMNNGDNARAALMTRGLYEISRLSAAMGAKPKTFLGLAGVGDLIVTCGSMHSRNRRCGILLGQGAALELAQKEVGQVVEGVSACYAAHALSEKYGVEMPITNLLYKVLTGETDAKGAMKTLLSSSIMAE